ncbi:hypothetical protein MKY48_15195 [Paenibacillus sp. FSL W8-0187]|nr:hypothetical protein [Paenibacillus lautus]
MTELDVVDVHVNLSILGSIRQGSHHNQSDTGTLSFYTYMQASLAIA